MKRAEQIIQEFEEQVKGLQQQTLPPNLLASKGIYLSKQSLTKLKKWNAEKEFKQLSDEVHFFKNLKSIPMSYFIFFAKIRSYELRKPKAGIQYQMAFLKKKLKRINKFFNHYAEFTNYMETGETYLDHYFFSKSHQDCRILRPLTRYTQFSEFETSHDLLWAKIKAMHKLIEYIKQALIQLQCPSKTNVLTKQYNLKWTASKVAMTELVYALYAARAVNSGKADLKEIVRAFQHVFQIDLGDFYHTFGEIRARKIQLTKFIDHLKIALEQRMYDADE